MRSHHLTADFYKRADTHGRQLTDPASHMEKQSYFRYSTYRVQVDELLDMSCALLVSGGQILEGDVELFVKRNISMIPSEVPHSSTEVRINSKK